MPAATSPLDTPLKSPVGAAWELVGDQMVVAIRSARRPIVLDPVSSAVWPLLAGGGTTRQAIDWAAGRCGVEPASAHASMPVVVDRLMTAGFLVADLDDRAVPDRRFRAAVSPCDAAPYLKGPTATVEVTLGGHVVSFVALQRIGGAGLLSDYSPRAGTTDDAAELFILGRPPRRGGAALADHHGNVLMASDVEGFGEVVRLLCDDLASQPQFDLGIRGVAIECEGGIAVMDERLRPALDAAVAGEGSGRGPAPIHVLGVRVGPDGLVVTARRSEPPFEHYSAPLAGLWSIDQVTGPASSVALCATFLVDITDFPAARWLSARTDVRSALAGDPCLTGWAVPLEDDQAHIGRVAP